MKVVVMNLLTQLLVFAASRRSLQIERKYLNTSIAKLSPEEKREVKRYWGRLSLPVNVTFHRLCKSLSGFDVRYLPEDIYHPYLKGALNPAMQSFVFENKCLYDLLFPFVPQPDLYLKNIYGQFYDNHHVAISVEQAIDLMLNVKSCIVKPGIYSDSGANVIKFRLSENVSRDEKMVTIRQLFERYKSNFVVQAVLDQCQDTAIYNPESVNTIRVTSLFLNGRVSLHVPIFRCGQHGSVVDNTGAGGIAVGILPDGCLRDFGYDLRLNKLYKSSNGIEFKGRRISGFYKIEEIISKVHRLIPTVHLIGWDFAFDRDGKPVMLEINTGFPGIIFEQFCSGPVFGERTEEVIEFVLNNPPRLKLAL